MTTYVDAPARDRSALWVAATVGLSWLGLYVHNRSELPHLTLLSPENSLVALGGGVLFGAWMARPDSRVVSAVLLGWGLLHLVGGGILSVLPLGLFPFVPEQSARHYLFHVVYGSAQLPLIVTMLEELRTHGPEEAGEAASRGSRSSAGR